MARRTTTAYRPTPTNPNLDPTRLARESAIEDLDDFLEEIDDLLELNALEVIRAYRQRGGE